jgi:dTDP-4-amino-4,6-dideoxygalactose transaminase
MSYAIPLFELNYDGAEEAAVLEVLRSKWISMGPKTAEFEAAFAAHTGAAHAVAIANCTAALHLVLAALGLGPGDEVIVPSLTFVATVNSVGYVGATPVFADIVGKENLCINPADVRRRLTPRTKAIIPMHYAGVPCDMDALGAIAREHQLFLIEDAAHAPTTKFRGQHVGTFGDAACFSFYSNKNLACAEGGMVTTNRKDIADKVRLMRSHGMTSLSYDRSRGHATEYDVVARGYNFRMDDIRSALALAQMKKLAADTAMRARVVQKYRERLGSIDELAIPFANDPNDSSYYIFPVALREGGMERRNRVREFLAKRGIETSVHYPAAHRFSIYSGSGAELPQTDWATDHEITLPLFAGLSDAQLDQIVAGLRASLS